MLRKINKKKKMICRGYDTTLS